MALALAVLGTGWFLLGPADVQRLGIHVLAPILAGMIGAGQWRISGDCRLPAGSRRFWRILALAMFTYTAGMVVDAVALIFRLPISDAGETVMYPVAGLFTVVALLAFPTTVRNGAERLRMALDGVTVLLAGFTFVWYFLVSRRWAPGEPWQELSDGLVLPGLTLVIGFVILRITMVGLNVMTKQTTACFVIAAASAATPIIIGAPPDTPTGRMGSVVYLAGFLISVVGVAIQRHRGSEARANTQARHGSFTLLPVVAVASALVLLLMLVREKLDYRAGTVAIGVLALCVVVMIRQLTSLWEICRLLKVNQTFADQLRHQAFHDRLTGLANRAGFTDRVTEALARAAAGGPAVAVLFIDLDDFKIVNDGLGHRVGDELLAAVAQRLRRAIPAGDLLGRLGGDEFGVLVHADPADAAAVAGALVAAFATPFEVAGMAVAIKASVGVASTPNSSPTSAADLLRDADVAMYSAKHARKGSWRTFQPEMLAVLRQRHRLLASLAQAVSRGELIVYYQPIVDLLDGSVHGAEALVRWRRADGGLMIPSEFIPLAEETGLVTEIDRWVLHEACRQVGQWRRTVPGAGSFALHVNVSARHLHRPEVVSDVASALREGGMPADGLTVEVTESGLGSDHEAAIEGLTELGRLGVHLAIDDFGTGYSSLSYLRRMPLDVLKIDKSFTDELTGGSEAAPLAQAVIALASTLGMHTVAEGIEEPGQAHRLLALGCRYGQGFYYAEPLSAEQIERFLYRSAAREQAAPSAVVRTGGGTR